VSHRGSHSLIGVYDFAHQTIVWLSPSLDYDSPPAFSPDGARIAFIRVLAEKTLPDFFPRRSGRPWSIWTADVITGQRRRVWIPDAGTRQCLPYDDLVEQRHFLDDEPVLDQP
jgi:Tol biopolymer transport system component